ncbi:hypothetical protein D3C81_1316760 [compost metagenome]
MNRSVAKPDRVFLANIGFDHPVRILGNLEHTVFGHGRPCLHILIESRVRGGHVQNLSGFQTIHGLFDLNQWTGAAQTASIKLRIGMQFGITGHLACCRSYRSCGDFCFCYTINGAIWGIGPTRLVISHLIELVTSGQIANLIAFLLQNS